MTWVRGYPIYAAHFIAALLVISMIATTIVVRAGIGWVYQYLPFSSTAVLRGELWRILSYGFVNPPSLQFVIDVVLIVWFGREVERRVGRKVFLCFYGAMYLTTPLLLTAIGIWFPMEFVGATGALAVFTAFATLYPGAMMMFNILAKWAAMILVGTFTLFHFAYHNEPALFSLWVTNGFAFVFMQYHQGKLELPRLSLWKRKPRLRVLPDLPAKKQVISSKGALEDATMAEVDALLDKIAKSGISSLTPKERAKLEAAREGLMRRDASRR